jgi:hypothetical protein
VYIFICLQPHLQPTEKNGNSKDVRERQKDAMVILIGLLQLGEKRKKL